MAIAEIQRQQFDPRPVLHQGRVQLGIGFGDIEATVENRYRQCSAGGIA